VTAFVTNTNSIYQVTTTDQNGRYSFSGLQTSGNVPTDYQFWVSKAGYGFYPVAGTGATVTRAGYNGMFVGNGVTDVPVNFTVVDFVASAAIPQAGADFVAYDGSNPLVKLAQTGQQTSYASGDDAAGQKGVAWPAARFADNQDGTVTDRLTGLVWLKNAGCFTPTTWNGALADANQLANGACGLSDGSTAGQWRLPNLNELESLIDVSASNPALPAGNPFNNVSNGIYWSSTSYYMYQAGSYNAWAIRLGDGRYLNDSVSNLKSTANNGVWAVKGTGGGAVTLQGTGLTVPLAAGDDGSVKSGVPLTYPRFLDNKNGTVTDTVTGLIWLKQADCINKPWAAAVSAVNSLASGQCGLSDGSTAGSWRMPNRNEMQSLADRLLNNQADFFNASFVLKSDGSLYRSPVFTNFMGYQYYWTSSTDAADTSEAWTVFSCDFGVYDTPKSNSGYTLAVR